MSPTIINQVNQYLCFDVVHILDSNWNLFAKLLIIASLDNFS
jgi:hypothetical protein